MDCPSCSPECGWIQGDRALTCPCKAKMIIANVYDLPNAKLSVQLEQLDPGVPLDLEDVETAEIFWGAFKKVIKARLRSAAATSGTTPPVKEEIVKPDTIIGEGAENS